MKAMIFTAGLGTRFKPWTDQHPKALAPVHGKSLLQRNIEYLQQYGIFEVIVNVHHFADQVVEAIQQHDGWGSRVHVSDERAALLDTGGGLLKAKPFFTTGEPFLTCNADILTDLNIHHLLAFHRNKKALVSFGIMKRETSRYFLMDEEDRLCGWINKKTGEIKGPCLEVSGGQVKSLSLKEMAYSCVVIFEYDIFNLMTENGFLGKFSLIDLYLTLSEDHLIMGFDHTGDRLVDVGKPGSIGLAESVFI